MDLFKLVGSIFIDTTEANDSLSKTDKKAGGVGETLAKVGKGAVKVGTAVIGGATALGTAMVGMAASSAESMDVIDKASQRMDISAESYQELAHAANLSGVEMSTMERAAKALEGTDMNFDEAIAEIYELGTAEERSAKAAELFGERVAYDLSPMLNASGTEMAAMRQEAHDLGLVFSEEAVASGAQLNDTLGNVKDSFGAIATGLGTSLMPIVQTVAEQLITYLPMFQGMFDSLAPVIMNLMQGILPPLMQLTSALLPLLAQLIQPLIQLATALLTPLLDLLNLILPPIIELGTAFAELLAETIGKAVKKATDFFVNFRDRIKTIFEQIKEFIKRPINAVIGFINGLIRGIVGGVNGVIRALNRFQIKVPAWITKLTGISQFGFNLAEVSAPQIPLLAKGADIEGSGAAVVGEAGAELVELPRGARVTPLGDNANLADKLDTLIALMQKMIHMGIYIDGNALVGEIAPQMDRQLGRMSVRAERWA